MHEAEVSRYILDSLAGVDMVMHEGNRFFFYNPDPGVPPDHRFPWATIVTSDLYDQSSNLNRPGVFRLNIGVGRQTFRARFGPARRAAGVEDAAEGGSALAGEYDFTALDRVMPHPQYGMMYWVCVLNPGAETFEREVRPLLAEAYALAVGKHDQKAARG